jgi:hypothetical protein
MIENIKDIIEQLTTKEKEFVNTNAIDTPLKLIPLLLKRVNPQNVQTLASLIKKSVLPSICSKTNDEIDELFTQIEKVKNL